MAFNVISFEFLSLLKTLDEILMFDIGLEFCIIIYRILSFSYVSIYYVYVKMFSGEEILAIRSSGDIYFHKYTYPIFIEVS